MYILNVDLSIHTYTYKDCLPAIKGSGIMGSLRDTISCNFAVSTIAVDVSCKPEGHGSYSRALARAGVGSRYGILWPSLIWPYYP